MLNQFVNEQYFPYRLFVSYKFFRSESVMTKYMDKNIYICLCVWEKERE